MTSTAKDGTLDGCEKVPTLLLRHEHTCLLRLMIDETVLRVRYQDTPMKKYCEHLLHE